jgi:3-deoxy-D-manno-octulosonic-acid transferase
MYPEFWLYTVSIYFYVLYIRIAALVSSKARLWIKGRKNIFEAIEKALEKDKDSGKPKIAWFHCASLGEFEQGRPVIEAFREKFPEYRIFLTFFSPSGYEIRKNYTGADYIYYLPADTGKNAKRFIGLVNPSLAIFIKYEFWFNLLDILKQRKIPVYLVSAIFRPDQHFFRWYGGWSRKKLDSFTWFFVQDTDSARLLQSVGFSNVTVSGDTRFDRVAAISTQKKDFPVICQFCASSRIILAGSTWPEDERILLPYINSNQHGLKYIIAPHEISKTRVKNLTAGIKKNVVNLSEANEENIKEAGVLIIDSIGILASLYRYSYIAYIGGGFGAGIHNILEAAAYGIPVVFGPKYEKFREARELTRQMAAFPVVDSSQFGQVIESLLMDETKYKYCSKTCMDYVSQNKGATEKILKKINA